MYLLLAVPLTFLFIGILIGLFISAPGYKGPKTENFNGKKFKNYDGVKARGFLDVLKWAANREKGEWRAVNDKPTTVPNPFEDKLTIYFINHATFLIQWKGKNILTDPIWSKRTSPFRFVGPRRMRPPGIAFKSLPKIDLVLLSHNHYDHLDLPTVKKLHQRHQTKFIVPLGVDLLLKNHEIDNVETFQWWENLSLDDLQIQMVPAQHFSGRGILDRDRTLWGGYMIFNDKKKVYFLGDSGYNERMFNDISKEHPAIEIALIPIGAYKPRWFMSPIHMDPYQAVQVHQLMNIKKSIGMHYGTFPLADEGEKESPEDLAKALNVIGVAKDQFVLLEPGEKI